MTRNIEIITAFAGTVFAADAEKNPVFSESIREVRKTAKSAARTINFKAPVLKVDALTFAIELAKAKATVATEHTDTTKNPDGTESEVKRTSTLLADEVSEFLADRSEDAHEAYLTKGQIVEYFGSYIYGVSKDRETEKSVTDKLRNLRADLGQLYMALEGEWSDDVAKTLGVPDREAAVARRDNLVSSVISFTAKLREITETKAKREAKKAPSAK
jgi:hypothetical protein